LDLFETEGGGAGGRAARMPLAERMRPKSLDEFVGQEQLVGEGSLLKRSLDAGQIGSLLLWGPPGSGKTTLARLLASHIHARFVAYSAVTAGVAEIRAAVAAAREELKRGRRTLLFLDEIHRFNKAQQDSLLPHVEDGTILLVGATTENPSFEVISPLLSRARVFTLEPLSPENLALIVGRAVTDERGVGPLKVDLGEGALEFLAASSSGDARVALGALEFAVMAARPGADGRRMVSREALATALMRPNLRYDKSGEEHFNQISALHKSLRNSDADAALYWLARMLESGEDPLYIARRLVRFASEDVGLADPAALVQALAARDAVHFIGPPEGHLALAQAAVYLAAAPKSNSLYRAYGEAAREVNEGSRPAVPLHLRNAPTGLMKDLGYGRDYEYAHDFDEGVAGMDCLPDSLRGRRFYRPGSRGYEAEIGRRLDEWRKKRAAARGGPAE
jgi:putative ATPase